MRYREDEADVELQQKLMSMVDIDMGLSNTNAKSSESATSISEPALSARQMQVAQSVPATMLCLGQEDGEADVSTFLQAIQADSERLKRSASDRVDNSVSAEQTKRQAAAVMPRAQVQTRAPSASTSFQDHLKLLTRSTGTTKKRQRQADSSKQPRSKQSKVPRRLPPRHPPVRQSQHQELIDVDIEEFSYSDEDDGFASNSQTFAFLSPSPSKSKSDPKSPAAESSAASISGVSGHRPWLSVPRKTPTP